MSPSQTWVQKSGNCFWHHNWRQQCPVWRQSGCLASSWRQHKLSNTHFRFNQSENIFLPSRCEKQFELFYSRNNSGNRVEIFQQDASPLTRANISLSAPLPSSPKPPMGVQRLSLYVFKGAARLTRYSWLQNDVSASVHPRLSCPFRSSHFNRSSSECDSSDRVHILHLWLVKWSWQWHAKPLTCETKAPSIA